MLRNNTELDKWICTFRDQTGPRSVSIVGFIWHGFQGCISFRSFFFFARMPVFYRSELTTQEIENVQSPKNMTRRVPFSELYELESRLPLEKGDITSESSENVWVQEQNGLDKEEASASQATIKTLINIAKAIEIQCLEESANEEALQEKHSDMSTGNQLEYLEVRNRCEATRAPQKKKLVRIAHGYRSFKALQEILKRIMSSVLDNLKRRAHAEKAFREISEKYGELLGLYSDATLTGQQ